MKCRLFVVNIDLQNSPSHVRKKTFYILMKSKMNELLADHLLLLLFPDKIGPSICLPLDRRKILQKTSLRSVSRTIYNPLLPFFKSHSSYSKDRLVVMAFKHILYYYSLTLLPTFLELNILLYNIFNLVGIFKMQELFSTKSN